MASVTRGYLLTVFGARVCRSLGAYVSVTEMLVGSLTRAYVDSVTRVDYWSGEKIGRETESSH
jgi:hypothetical protein